MASASRDDAAAVFDPLRPALIRVAYRMLGSVADAEDVVQDAFLRWLDVDRDAVREPAAFLRRIVTRLCLDRLKSLRRERERYVGSWLPEPVVESGEEGTDDVTLPLLMALERLSPLERAAFLLHDVFGLGFEEVAATIERDPAACRQLASRARAHVRADRPRYPVARERGLEIAEAFFAASRDGEMDRPVSYTHLDVYKRQREHVLVVGIGHIHDIEWISSPAARVRGAAQVCRIFLRAHRRSPLVPAFSTVSNLRRQVAVHYPFLALIILQATSGPRCRGRTRAAPAKADRHAQKIWRRMSHVATARRHVCVPPIGDDDDTDAQPVHRRSYGNTWQDPDHRRRFRRILGGGRGPAYCRSTDRGDPGVA